MRRTLIAALLLLCSAGLALASGGQNQGTTGQGTTSTGSTSQGSASQDRSGR